MSTARRLASKLLRAVVRHSPSRSQEWANAMLRELDFIENDWAALFWALGSTTAIFRHSLQGLRDWFGNPTDHEKARMKNIRKKTVGVLSGILLASALVLCAFGLLFPAASLFPKLGLDRLGWSQGLAVIVIPETIFTVAIVMLWRKKGSFAMGILLSAIVLAVHAVIHVATSIR
jgi:hypothetical protein